MELQQAGDKYKLEVCVWITDTHTQRILFIMLQINTIERWSSKTILPEGLPGDLADLSVVHGAEDRGITHPLTDPQLNADAGVEEEHGSQG